MFFLSETIGVPQVDGERLVGKPILVGDCISNNFGLGVQYYFCCAAIDGRVGNRFALDIAHLNGCTIGVRKSFGFTGRIVNGEPEIVSHRGDPDRGCNGGAVSAVRHEGHIFGGGNRVSHGDLGLR